MRVLSRARGSARRICRVWILAGGLALACFASTAGAWQSAHDAVDLVWSLDGAQCTATALALVADGVWTAAVALPEDLTPGAHAVQLQFMVDGSMLPAHYGQDITRSDGVVLAADPPNIRVTVEAPGYACFTLKENALTYAVEPAAGSITARIEYADTPPPIPADVLERTRAVASDLTAGLVLGTYFCSLSDARLIAARLAPGRTYELTFTAPGYSAASATVALDSDAEQEISVIMQKIVANETLSWSGIKNLYR